MKLNMDNIKPKSFMVSTNMRQHFPNSEVIYTIQVYTQGRIWSDFTYDITSILGVSQEEYFEFMQSLCEDSKIINRFLYFKNITDCKKAIGNLENLIIMSKLTR
jgi:hypothetical protein